MSNDKKGSRLVQWPMPQSADVKPGSRVMMSTLLKAALSETSPDHVEEFGQCVGVVVGPTDYNNVPPTDASYDPSKVGPEVDVRWQPSNLRYAYDPDMLVVIVD